MGRMTARGTAQLVAVSCLSALSACRAEPEGQPYAREVAEAIPRIEESVGLKYKTVPKIEVRSREQVRDFLLKKFDESSPAEEVKGEEAAYKQLGLIP